jgi:serine/threonine protein kinase
LPEVFEQIMKADFDFPDPYWTEISKEAKDFISKLLVVESKKRLTAKQAMEHPWIAVCISIFHFVSHLCSVWCQLQYQAFEYQI